MLPFAALSVYNCLFIIMLGKYFPTPEVGVVPETIKDHDLVQQGNDCKTIAF